MSSASSAVTYTSVYTNSESGRLFWGADEELSDGDSPRVIVYGYDGLPILPVAPPSPDYLHDPDFVPELIYPKYIPLEDEHVLQAEVRPLPPVVLPTAESPEYVAESDPEEDPEDDEDEDEEDEEEEQLALVDSAVVIPTDELVSSSEGTELVMPPPSTDTTTIGARDDILETEMPPRKRLCLSTLGFRYEVEESFTTRPTGGRGIDYSFVSTLDAEVRRRGIGEVGYDIRDTWVDPTETVPEIEPMTVGEVNTQVTELVELHEHDAQDLYAPLEDAQDSRTCISQRVVVDSYRVDLLMEDKIAHQETIQITEIAELRETDRRHQAQMVETLRVMGDMRREMGDMQGELLELRELPRRARRPRGDARVPNHKDAPGDADSSKPKTLDKTIEFANDLMDQELRTFAERQTNNKRKADDSFRNNHGPQQQTPKRCYGNANVANAQRNNGANLKGNGCFECGAPGHFKRDCLKLKNKDGGKVNAPGWVYAVGNAKKRWNALRDPDSNIVTGTFLLNNRYASILFDTGADRSFISTTFSSLIDVVPTPLGNSYDVELADGKIVGVDTIMWGCTLNFFIHSFNIDLMPVELASFDVIIGMDWLRRCHVVIMFISCSKAKEYMAKGCQIFLAHISAKKEEDISEGKQLEDVPVVQDFPEVFPKDLLGLPLARPVEFQIDLIPGATPVARAP
nr:hypothetical protein [Tanacetum cinerariifolium]